MFARTTGRRYFAQYSAGSVKPGQTKLLIDGKFVNSVSGKTFDTVNPATEEKIVSVQEADAADVDAAVKAARKAFDHGPWRRMSGAERGKLLFKLTELVEKNYDELCALEALDNGKPMSFAQAADVNLVVKTYRHYAGWADKIHGSTFNINGPF